MLNRAELSAWLRLTESVGAAAARRLLAVAGSPQAVFELPAVALVTLEQALPASDREALSHPPEHLAELVDRAQAWQAEPGHSLLVLGAPDFPALLLATADPPPLLWLQGRRDLLTRACIAVVGNRNPTPQGSEDARLFAGALARAGHTIVSDLSPGVDAAAHEGALEAGGSMIAVVGTGLDQLHPPHHEGLAARILAADGLIVSECSPWSQLKQENFLRHHRIIAGLSRACLVVEASLRSDALVAAEQAAEAGREVFAVPGSIHAPQVRGCHALIRRGAKLVESAEDVLDGLMPLAPPARQTESLPRAQRALLDAMGADPISLDALMARCGWPAAELSAALLELELRGEVTRLAGQGFQRRKQA